MPEVARRRAVVSQCVEGVLREEQVGVALQREQHAQQSGGVSR